MRNSLKRDGVGWLFILTVLLIYPLPQLTIDIYLPSWPAMAAELHTNNTTLQLTLILYILSLGIAQLIYGPLAERFNRKFLLLFGCGVFFVSSLAGAFSNSIQQLLVFRVIQGLGIGCGFTIASAILADRFEGKRLAQMTSYSAMVYSASIIFAPMLGGYIQHYIGWRANFAIMAGYALGLSILIALFLDDNRLHSEQVAISIKKVIHAYFSFFKNKSFICNVLCLTMAYGVMVVFSIVGPFLFEGRFQLSDIDYGSLLLFSGLAYFFGATANSRLVDRWGMPAAVNFGLSLMAVSGFGLLLVDFLQVTTVFNVICLVCLALFGIGFVYPNCFAKALDLFPGKGYAGALIGSAILIGVSLISNCASQLNSGQISCLAYMFLVLIVINIASWLLVVRLDKRKEVLDDTNYERRDSAT